MKIKKFLFLLFIFIIIIYVLNNFKKFINKEVNPNLPIINTPLKIPDIYKWDLIDMNKEKDLNESHNFLKNNYLESGKYNIEYSKDLIKKSLDKYTSIVLRKRSNNNIIGFISRIMRKINIYGKILDMFEIDFLSINKKERNKYIAPVLIKEMERLCNYENKWARALFIINHRVPKYNKITTFPGFMRPINCKKLLKEYMVDESYDCDKLMNNKYNFRLQEIKEENILQCCNGLNKFCKKNFDIFYIYTPDTFKKVFCDPDDIKSFIVKDSNDNVTDFVSFFIATYISSDNKKLRYASLYSYFNTSNKLEHIIMESIKAAKKNNCDYMIATGLGHYNKFVKYCNFFQIYSSAYMYLFNWIVSHTDRNKVFINFLG